MMMGKVLFILLILVVIGFPLRAQELEPRSLTNVPVGWNFVVLGYGFARGNILLDPSIPIEDLDSRLHTFIGAYVRAINFFGMSGKVDLIVPFAAGDWEGLLEGEQRYRSVNGFGDPRIRLSVNFVGAPSLHGDEYRNYKQNIISGASLQIIVPLGQYDSSKLINLGTNRWTIRPQIGIAKTAGPWILEAYASGWFFTKNSNFYGGLELSQNPLLTSKVHLIRSMRKGRWIALDVGYGFGGRTTVNDIPKDTYISTFRFGFTLAFPLNLNHTLRLVGASAVRLQKGADFDALAVTYQYRWVR